MGHLLTVVSGLEDNVMADWNGQVGSTGKTKAEYLGIMVDGFDGCNGAATIFDIWGERERERKREKPSYMSEIPSRRCVRNVQHTNRAIAQHAVSF